MPLQSTLLVVGREQPIHTRACRHSFGYLVGISPMTEPSRVRPQSFAVSPRARRFGRGDSKPVDYGTQSVPYLFGDRPEFVVLDRLHG